MAPIFLIYMHIYILYVFFGGQFSRDFPCKLCMKFGLVILHDEKHNFKQILLGSVYPALRHERSYGSFVAFDGGEWCNQHRCAGTSQCGFSDAEKFWNLAVWAWPCQIYEPWYCRGGYIVTVLNVIYTNCNVHCTQYQGVQRLTIPLFSILLCKAQCFSKTLQFVNRGKCLFSNSLAHHCITTLSLAFLIQIGTQPLRGFDGLDWIHDQERCMEINLPWALIDAAQRRWVNEKMAMGQDSLGAVGTLGALGWWRNAQQIEINVTALTGCIDFLAKKDQIALWLQEILLVKPGSRWSHWEGRSFQEVARGVEEFFFEFIDFFCDEGKNQITSFCWRAFCGSIFLYFFLVGNVKRWNFRKECDSV